jgi:hypothetical protein
MGSIKWCGVARQLEDAIRGWLSAAAPLIGEGLPVAYATGSLPPRDELPLINVQTALNLDYDSGGLEPHQVRNRG